MTNAVLELTPVTVAPADRPRPETSLKWSLLLVIAAALAVYANSLWNGFAYDDDWIIVRNDRVHQLSDLGQIWGTPYWPTFGTILGLYRPLAIFAYAVEWALADGQPWVFHAVNVVLHAANSGLVLLLLAAFVPVRAALVGALVFAVHPVHTEVVANSVGQAELLSGLGVIGACALYARRPRDTNRISRRLVGAIAACYLFALLAKEASITLPALLVVLDVAQGRIRFSRRGFTDYAGSIWLAFFALAATAVLYLAVRVDVLGSISGSDAAPGLPFLREEHRALTAFRTWPEYVRLLFFPKELSADYSPAVILPVESWTPMAILGFMVMVGVIVLAALTPVHVAAGLPSAWFFVSVITVSNLLFPVGIVLAERTLYLPSVAVAFLAGYAWQALEARANVRQWRLGAAVALCILGLMSYRTLIRNPEWKNTLKILTAVVRDHPESYHTAWLLADQYWRRGDVNQSAFYWEAAVLLWPRDSQLLLEFANFNIGRKNWRRAIELLEQSRAMHPWVPRVHEMLAFSYVHAGRPADALVAANEAFRLGSASGLMYAIRASAYEQLGRFDESVGAWRAASRQPRGSLWLYHAMMVRTLARSGRTAAALAAADSAYALVPGDSVPTRVVQAVRTAVRAGCYGAAAAPDCPDPLAGWTISVNAPPVADRARPSQNARKAAVRN